MVADVFGLLARAGSEGRRAALVTIVGLTGSSARSVGTHMAVVDDGRFVGSFSGGCVEAAVVAEAQRAIADGNSRVVRFGSGSPYIDIRLPCGGGMDLLFQPNPPGKVVEAVLGRLAERRPMTLRLATSEPRLSLVGAPAAAAATWQVRHAPPLKLSVLGHGEECLALAQLALAFGAEVAVQSPDAAVVEAAATLGIEARHLSTAAMAEADADPWTAIVLLFHDHDWEPPILEKALAGPAFYIGAMGSAATHAARIERLLQADLSEASVSRVHGPIGLIPASRNPSMLALSTLAQVAAEYQRLIA